MKSKEVFEISDSNFALQNSLRVMRCILGENVSGELLRECLRGADGNVEIALNHILNKLEKEPMKGLDQPSPLEKLLSEVAEEVKCPLCLCYFSHPVVLGCFHTFCAACLEAIVIDKTFVHCPLCRSSFTLDERGVRGLKYNHYLANIAEKLKSAQGGKICVECEREASTVYCRQCSLIVCNACDSRIHSVESKQDHSRNSLECCFPLSSISSTSPNADETWELDHFVPFQVEKEICTDIFFSWIRELWFAPLDLERKISLQEFQQIYVPYWQFEVISVHSNGDSRFDCSKSIYWCEEPSFRSERRELHGNDIDGNCTILACDKKSMISRTSAPMSRTMLTRGCRSCPEASLLNMIDPWKLSNTTLFNSEDTIFRAGDIDIQTAWRDVRKKMQSQCSSHEGLTSSSFSCVRSRRIYMPVYSTMFEYQGKQYQFIINGSTAKAHGQRPYSTGKLASLSITGVGAVIGIITSRVYNQ